MMVRYGVCLQRASKTMLNLLWNKNESLVLRVGLIQHLGEKHILHMGEENEREPAKSLTGLSVFSCPDDQHLGSTGCPDPRIHQQGLLHNPFSLSVERPRTMEASFGKSCSMCKYDHIFLEALLCEGNGSEIRTWSSILPQLGLTIWTHPEKLQVSHKSLTCVDIRLHVPSLLLGWWSMWKESKAECLEDAKTKQDSRCRFNELA